VFLDESGFMLQPLRRRTWAPCGQTPIHYAWDRHDRWSVIGALSLAPWALRIGVYFQLHDHNIVTDDVVEFVKHLHRQLGRKLILVWDRWNVHRSAAKRLARYPWFQIEWLPAYAPELNPVEAMWNHTKYSDLANFIPDDAEHLGQSIRASIASQRHDAYLKHSYFRYAHLVA
jgi:transposase